MTPLRLVKLSESSQDSRELPSAAAWRTRHRQSSHAHVLSVYEDESTNEAEKRRRNNEELTGEELYDITSDARQSLSVWTQEQWELVNINGELPEE